MSFDTGDAILRLSACGIDRSLAVNLVKEINRWITSSGEEWTVKRLKAIKLDYLRHLAGLGPVSEWIRHSKSGKPAGHFGALWKFDRRSVFKCWNALMVYTGINRDNAEIKMTEKQYIKFIKALYRSEPSEGSIIMGETLIDNALLTQNFARPTLVTGSPLLGEPWLEALSKTDVRTRSYTSKTSLLNTLLYNSRFVSEHNEGLDPSLASDQEVQVLLDNIFRYNPKDYPMQMLPNVEYLLRLIDDGGTPPAVFDSPHMVGNATHILHSFSQLEKATEITELIRMERLLLHHT